MNPLELALRYARSGLRRLVIFSLPAALIGLVVAAVVNPTAPADDLAVLVAIPLLLFVLLMQARMVWRPLPLTPQEIEEAGRSLRQALHEFRWFLPLLLSVSAFLWALCSLLAVPIYWAFGLDTALILYGFVWAGILFGAGVALFGFALYLISPSIPAALVRGALMQVLGMPLTRATSFMLSVLRP